LERHAHSLAGSAATFGWADLGLAAQALELAIEPHVSAGQPLAPEVQAEVAGPLKNCSGAFTARPEITAKGSHNAPMPSSNAFLQDQNRDWRRPGADGGRGRGLVFRHQPPD
jgi:hypothetical protein